jgi:hypothetical protein
MQQERADGLTVIEGGKGPAASIDQVDRSTGLSVGSKAWSSKVRRRAKELKLTLDSGFMELARILYLVWDTPVEGDPRKPAIYTAWGHDTFKDYVERELEIDIKRAQRLRRMWWVLEVQLKELSPDMKQRVVNLGETKVRELIKVLSLRNVESFVSQAETMNYKEVEKAVIEENRRRGVIEAASAAGELGDGEDSSEEPASVEEALPTAVDERSTREHFELFPAQLLNVRLAIKRAQELCHSDKKSHALDLICTDFLATNDSMAGDDDKRLRYIAKIERTLGLRLMAVDPVSKEIVYGMDALKLVAGD